MRSTRRIAIPALTGVLALGLSLLVPPASQGSDGAIFVLGGSTFQVSALTGVAMTESEELQIAAVSGALGT